MSRRGLHWAFIFAVPALIAGPGHLPGAAPSPACSACFKPAFENGARSYATGSRGSGSVAIADFNGDGFLDLAYADFPDPFYIVMLGGPLGRFVSSRTYPLPSSSHAMAAADFDGDNKIDLVTDAGEGFRILRGRGDGSFEPPRVVSVGYTPYTLAVGDFNGDGHPDVVIQRIQGLSTGIIDFYFGNGSGGFVAAGQDVPAPDYLLDDLYVADLDRDGRDDVLAWSSNASSFSVVYGSSGLPFPDPVSFPVGRMFGVVAGDFNEDGRPDIAVSDDQHQLSFYYNAGNRVFNAPLYRAAPIGSLAVGDFNGDGHGDLAISGGVLEILAGGGDGSFTAADYPGWAGQMRVADLNRDGISDIVFNPGFSIDVVLSGPGGIRMTPTLPTFNQTLQLLKGDFNGDGHEDLFVSATSGVQVMFGDGSGRFTPGPVSILSPQDVGEFSTGRFDSDSKTDLVFTTGARLSVFRSVGDGTFTQLGSDVVLSSFGSSLAVGDLNADGLDDVVVSHGDNTLEVRLTLNSGGLGPASYQDTGNYPRAPVLADLDGDGKLDVLVGNAISRDVSILLGDGKGSFRSNSRYAVGDDPVGLLVADFDGDGRADVGAFYFFKARVEFHRGDGTGGIGPAAFSLAVPSEGRVQVADVNGDGLPDIVAAGPLTVYSNHAGVSFEPGVGFWGGLNRELRFVIGDFNEDGKPDVASISYYENAIVVLLNARCVPAALSLVNEPSSCSVAGSVLTPPLLVSVVDAGDNPVGCATGSVAASLVPGTGSPGATLSGPATTSVVGGQAEFPGLIVDRPGIGYQLQFAAPGLASVRSAHFNGAVDASACRAFVHRSNVPRNVSPRPTN